MASMKKAAELVNALELRALQHAEGQLAAANHAHLAMQVHGLLNALREMEEYTDRLSDHQFNGAIRDAILACGFADEVDAWQGIMEHLRSGPCHESSCQERFPVG
jgi:hypothetical protein